MRISPCRSCLTLLALIFSAATGLADEEPELEWALIQGIAIEGAKDAPLEICKELAQSKNALEKLARQSRFRQFSHLKTLRQPFDPASAAEVPFENNLFLSFRVNKGEKGLMLAAQWFYRDDKEKPENIRLTGGKVNNAISPDHSLAILGPRLNQGSAMMVMRLEKARKINQTNKDQE